jgi:hypothetical protein
MQEDPIDEQASVHGVRRCGLFKAQYFQTSCRSWASQLSHLHGELGPQMSLFAVGFQ